MKYCPHCGSELVAETKFCPFCGKNIEVYSGASQAPDEPSANPTNSLTSDQPSTPSDMNNPSTTVSDNPNDSQPSQSIKFWLRLVSTVCLIGLFFLNWVSINASIEVPFVDLSTGSQGEFSILSINSRFNDINDLFGYIGVNSSQFSSLLMTARILLVLAIISFILLIISLAAYKSKSKAVLARLGFGFFALVPIIFVISISNLNQQAASLTKGIIKSLMDFTPFPFIALILAIIGIIFFVEHPTKQRKSKRKSMSIKKMTIWSAIFIVLMYVLHFPIFPSVPFLEYVPTDIAIFMGTFAFGPLAGFGLTIIVSAIQGLTISANAGLYGIIMNILATGSFVLVAGNIYKRNKSRKSVLISMFAGTVVMLIVMFGAHLVATPWYMGVPMGAVLSLMPSILGFNLIKIGFNSIVTFLLYICTDGGIEEQTQ